MRYLLVDAHSVIFSWPELHALHQRNGLVAREELTRKLTAYQDATGVRVVVVFDGKGARSNSETMPGGIQVFYSGGGKTADCIIIGITTGTTGSGRGGEREIGSISIKPIPLRRVDAPALVSR